MTPSEKEALALYGARGGPVGERRLGQYTRANRGCVGRAVGAYYAVDSTRQHARDLSAVFIDLDIGARETGLDRRDQGRSRICQRGGNVPVLVLGTGGLCAPKMVCMHVNASGS